MEQNINITLDDGHVLYGVLNSEEKNDKLIIFVHGLTGDKNEHLFYNAARFFPPRGFDTFRFDLYSGEKGGRALSECTLETHAADLQIVINYFTKKYSNLYLVGHSLGGPTILFTKQDAITSVALWDPSFRIIEWFKNHMQFESGIDKFIVRWGTEYLLSKEMVEGWEQLDDRLLNYFQKPTKIICAGEGGLYKDWEDRVDDIKVEYAFCIIKKAGHCFDEENTETELFNETLAWFER